MNPNILRQARLAAQLQTDPQFSALKLLLGQAQSDYKTGVKQARGGAAMLEQAAKVGAPRVAGYFNTAGKSISRNLGSVGINPSTVQGPAQADIADTLNRLAASQAGAQTEFAQRGVDAAAGANFQVENLGNQRAVSVGKIGQQLLDLAGTKGKVEQSTLLTLLNQAAGRQVTERGQTLSHNDRVAGQKETRSYHQQQIDIRRGIDPVTGKRLSTGRNAAGALTPHQVQANTSKAADEVAEAATWYKQLRKGGNSKQAIKAQLLSGGSIQVPVIDPQTKKPETTGTTNPQTKLRTITIPKLTESAVNAAQDLTDFGFLTHDTTHQLRIRGVHAESIGALAPHFKTRFTGTGRPKHQRPT